MRAVAPSLAAIPACCFHDALERVGTQEIVQITPKS